MITVTEALWALRPGAKFIVRGEVYSGIEWLDQDLTKPTESEVQDWIARKKCEVALQEAMEVEARKRGYDSLLSAVSYAAQPPGAPFQAEGAAILAWRSDVWATAYAEDANGGPIPTPEEAVAMMPALVIPQ